MIQSDSSVCVKLFDSNTEQKNGDGTATLKKSLTEFKFLCAQFIAGYTITCTIPVKVFKITGAAGTSTAKTNSYYSIKYVDDLTVDVSNAGNRVALYGIK